MSITAYVHKLEHRTTSSDAEVRLNCHNCQDHKFHLYVNTRTGRWLCHKCGEKGGLFALVQNIEETKSIQEVKDILRRIRPDHTPTALAGLSASDILNRMRETERPPEKFRAVRMPKYASRKAAASVAASAYLRGRGFSTDDVEFYDLRVDDVDEHIIVPFYEEGTLVYYQIRGIYNGLKLNPPKGESLGKSVYLFNHDGARRERDIVIVEGWADAITVGRNAVSIQGKLLSKLQAEKLASIGKRFTFFFDADDDTAEFQVKSAQLLRKYTSKPIYMVNAYGIIDKDPNDLGRDRCRQIIQKYSVEVDTASIVKMSLLSKRNA